MIFRQRRYRTNLEDIFFSMIDCVTFLQNKRGIIICEKLQGKIIQTFEINTESYNV